MRLLSSLLVCSGLVFLGCSDGGGGDRSLPPAPGVTGNGLRLADLNNPANPRPGIDQYVNVTGVVVTAVDRFDETKDGEAVNNVYVQDYAHDPPEYGGIMVFSPSFNPPSLRVHPGDVLDVRSLYIEFAGPSTFLFPEGETLPELSSGVVSLRFEAKEPDAKLIDVDDLYDYEKSRRWMGMLVEVRDVKLFNNYYESANGRANAAFSLGDGKDASKLPRISNALTDLSPLKDQLAAGTQLKSVKGIVQYFASFSICPRSTDDIELVE